MEDGSYSSLCCLCRLSLPNDSRKKKRLHGRSCEKAKQTLQQLSNVPLDLLLETSHPNASLCKDCEKCLDSIGKLTTQLQKFRSQVIQNLQALSRTEQARIVRKRPSQSFSSSDHDENNSIPPVAAESTTIHMPTSCLSNENSVLTNIMSCSEEQTTTDTALYTDEPTHSSPPLTVVIPSKDRCRTYTVKTPSRKRTVKRSVRKCSVALASGIVNSPTTSKLVISRVASNMKLEMKRLSSVMENSFLRNSDDAIKRFSWDSVSNELLNKIPTLMLLLTQLIPHPEKSKPLICMLASQILKCRHPHMGLVQRVVSVLLYGNGTAKQVYSNLQPLNVCLSHKQTMRIIKQISLNHDEKVLIWRDELFHLIENPPPSNMSFPVASSDSQSLLANWSYDQPHSNPDSDSCSDLQDSDESDITAPSYSIITSGNDLSYQQLSESDFEDISSANHCDSDLDLNSSLQPEVILDPQQSSNGEVCSEHDCKMVIDNIDKNIKPSFERHDHKGQSIHYVHGYAVKSRINRFGLSNKPMSDCIPDPNVMLPSSLDIAAVKDDCVTLVARIIAPYFEEYKSQSSSVAQHIPSKYSKEMALKSEVVPLGVLPNDENKLNEMKHVLAHYMKYVPTMEAEGCLVLPNGSQVVFDNTQFDTKLIGGDQLTACRVRGTQLLRDSQDKRVDRYEGLKPVAEDWHARMVLMQTLWGRLYKMSSANEKGTLYQLRNVINRKSVPKNPEKNMKSSEDFLLLVIHAHVIHAAKTIKSHQSFDNVTDLAKEIISIFTIFSRNDDAEPGNYEDNMFLYATEVLSLGLIWHGFYDSIKEADGDRILCYWKFLLIIFKSTNHYNYAKEAVNLLLQYYYKFSEREKSELLWNRCVNTKGHPGTNMPCDLFMEHLNRRLKCVIRSMCANISPVTIQNAGRAIGPVDHICKVFENQTVTATYTDNHNTPKFGKDLESILDVLQQAKVFESIPGRCHPSFKQIKCGLMEKLSKDNLIKGIKKNIQNLCDGHY